MNIYLDIDGVLLANDVYPAKHATEFLKFVTKNFPVYWLTTHCRGDAEYTCRHLSDKLPEDALQYLPKIKPTNWTTWKTEAIDFSQSFRWFDDYIFEEEKQVLREHEALDSWVEIKLEENENCLNGEVALLGKYET